LKSLQSKVILIVAGVFVLFGIVNFGIQRLIIFPSFLALEQDEAIKDSKRIIRAIKREVHHLDSLTHDRSSRDDTYEFVKSPSKEYTEANLAADAFLTID